MKYLVAVFFLFALFTSCQKSGGSSTNSNYWVVKYEVDCTNPNTQVAIIIRDETGTVKTIGDVTNPSSTYKKVPWTYQANFSKDAGLIAARSLTIDVLDAYNFNSVTDKVTAKIYVDGNLVNQSSSAGAFGIMLTYILH